MSIPDHLKYTPEHEWLDIDGDTAKVGITRFAADALGDVVYIQLPAVGTTLTAGEPGGEIESTKSVSDIYAPADGEVVEINQAVAGNPGLVNSSPYEEGWLFRMTISGHSGLLDASAYEALTAGE
jgi:glycine cleavage system H protein